MFPFFFLFVMGGGGDFGSGSGSKFNCAARVGSGWVGSDDLGYGPGSGFSFEPVQTSIIQSGRTSKRSPIIHQPQIWLFI